MLEVENSALWMYKWSRMKWVFFVVHRNTVLLPDKIVSEKKSVTITSDH